MRVALLFLFFSQSIFADNVILSTSHAPIGVMRDHLTKKMNSCCLTDMQILL